ncbi:ABC transporter permease [Curvibacter sp. CHRR-16]|uniref:ABC transporter permease n=1 Tax=Curvibacter sp. CHRR-16 TaxID=2835872 RepID=UPI001BDA7AB3|nr:ABC transporter permease [Curvibacter sp. CHRR-16]MBT0568950.1 ABC transporter permease [Curvibacter sp. CHRR-16]
MKSALTLHRTALHFVLRMGVQAACVALAVGVLTFWMTKALPGDAAFRIAASRYGYDMVDAAAAQSVRAQLGLDQPIWMQQWRWLLDLLQLHLGNSMVSGEPVWDELQHLMGHTTVLALVAWLLALVLALCISVGLAAARMQRLARALQCVWLPLRTTPVFLTGLLLMLVLGVHAQWLPVAGHGGVEYWVLPASTLALVLLPGFVQVMQHALQQRIASDAFLFSLIKGLPHGRAVWRHAVPDMVLRSLTYAGMQLVLLVEGVVVVESLFAWPGIGHALVHAVIARDTPMIQGTALVMGLLFVLTNAVFDALSHGLDPRLRTNATHWGE